MRVARAPRTMVRTLRRRLLLVVAIAVLLVGVASVWGIRIVTDINAERQVHIAAQAVATWGTDDDGDRVINTDRLADAAAASTIVALLGPDDRVVAASSAPSATVSSLERIAADTGAGRTSRVDVDGRTTLFAAVDLPPGTVVDDGERTPVDRALVGISVEGSDRLVAALALAAVGIIAGVLIAVWVVVTLVVTRTTRSLTELTARVEDGRLDGMLDTAATEASGRPSVSGGSGGSGFSEFSETHAISTAIARLDARRDATERQLRDFVADASHELRTPLTKIQGWSELHFQSPDDADTTDRAFASIVEESERMRSLVDRLAQLARAEGAPGLSETVDLAAICREAADDAALLDPDRRITVNAPDRALVEGDRLTLTQLVRNLVGNALVHAGRHASVTIALESAQGSGADRASGAPPEGGRGRVTLTVADDGVGIPPSVRERAFDRFVTGDRRTGTGLGLAIAQAVALSHGGTIGLASDADQGTIVTVQLPRGAPARP
ncbi:MAG: hypothetical protein DI573_01940 [Microbacterium sp.]|uniref:sensor histidine kinase n=1 Tax=Microbacterium sp. TaxID=51671 RepID=UPI000DB23909|nr:HAMP domain-containing sensor histidine kinase [Microbacterium sp.]PZU41181.1 MAG: hypothetical protein DI573_01940 [Microbacterium sp.]